jgi:hypothetical protein
MLPTLKSIALSVLFLSPGLFLQTAKQPGLLKVASDPQGASITIGDKLMNGKTNATFVVTPGQYTVKAQGASGYLNCQPSPATVSSGQITTVVCK